MPMHVRQHQLSNGLTVLAEVNPEALSFAAGFFVRTGSRDEPIELHGVSHFLEHMMFKGTAKRTAEEVNRDFDALGASHNAYTTAEMTAYYAHVLPEYLDPATEILADILRPALRDADFEEERGVILEEIAMYEDQPMWVLYEHAMELYYRDHPLAHRVLGTKDSIRALSRDAMARYFEERYSADNCVVAVAGRVDFDALAARIGSLCGAWRPTRPQRVRPELRVAPCEDSLRLASATRHYLLLGAPAPGLADPARYAASMVAHLLGDDEGSKLYWALVETGLAEDASAQYDGRDGCGEILVTAVCDPEDAAEVEAICRREMAALLDSVDEDDLLRARSKIATAVTLAGERPAGRMNRIGALLSCGEPYRTLEAELARIDAVTIEDLRAYARRWPIEPVLAARLGPAE